LGLVESGITVIPKMRNIFFIYLIFFKKIDINPLQSMSNIYIYIYYPCLYGRHGRIPQLQCLAKLVHEVLSFIIYVFVILGLL
jgi:hypothetical protein